MRSSMPGVEISSIQVAGLMEPLILGTQGWPQSRPPSLSTDCPEGQHRWCAHLSAKQLTFRSHLEFQMTQELLGQGSLLVKLSLRIPAAAREAGL